MDNNAPLYNSRISNTYLEYISSNYPELEIPSLLEYAGIKNYEIEDPAHWLTQDQVDRLHEMLNFILWDRHGTESADIA